jgi:FkbM family methyltransferase
MYSQNDEERIIGDFFGNTVGRFLDIGAYDGVRNSNTRALALRGWSGVCIEPGPTAFMKLNALYPPGGPVKTINTAVTVNGGPPATFWESAGGYDGGQVSTLVASHREKWSRAMGVRFTEIAVPVLSVTELLARVGVDFDFLSLDVEGMTFDLFAVLPLDTMPLRCICVEHDGRIGDVLRVAAGFRQLSVNAENIILAR